MTTPSANSKDDKQNEKLKCCDAGGNDPSLENFNPRYADDLKKELRDYFKNSPRMFSVLYDLDLLPEQVKEGSFQEWKMFSVLSHFKDMDAHYLPQIQQLKQEVEEVSKDRDDLRLRLGRYGDQYREMQSQLLQANKRIEELERSNKQWIKWLYLFVTSSDGESLIDALKREHSEKYRIAYDHGQSEQSEERSNFLEGFDREYLRIHGKLPEGSQAKDAIAPTETSSITPDPAVPTTEANSIKP